MIKFKKTERLKKFNAMTQFNLESFTQKFHTACENGDLLKVKTLLKNNINNLFYNNNNKDIRDFRYFSLIKICEYGQVNILNFLINHPIYSVYFHPNSINEGISPLMISCGKGHLKMVDFLLTSPLISKKPNLEYADGYGRTALFEAVASNEIDIIDYLLKSPKLKVHANLYHKNIFGEDIFIYSCQLNKLNIINFLLFELNMVIDEKNMRFLSESNGKYNNILSLIETRDRHNTLNQKLSNKIPSSTRVKI